MSAVHLYSALKNNSSYLNNIETIIKALNSVTEQYYDCNGKMGITSLYHPHTSSIDF